MQKLFELVGKYGGAGGIIGALAVYLVCSNSVQNTDKTAGLLEYRVTIIEQQQKEERNAMEEKLNFIAKSLGEINVKLSRFEVMVEKRKN
jgi:hypothetical protein